MKKEYIKENNIIEQFLLNKLSDEERKAFRVALLFDEKLRQEVEDTRLLHQQIQQLKPQNNKFKKTTWLAGIFLLSVLISFFIYNNSTTKDQTIDSKTKTSSTNEELNELPKEIIEKKKSSEEEALPKEIIEKEELHDIVPVIPKKVDETIDFSQPIASTDIKSHPYLDQFTNGTYRNEESKLEMSSPKLNESLKIKDGKVKIRIKGKLSIKNTPKKDRFVVRFFSNKKADFDNFKPIISLNPAVKQVNGGYELSSNSIVPLKEGLYYFIIEDNEIEDMIFVGKFQVVK